MMYWTAFLLGLGGSLHCAGMCGPIVLALPLTKREKWAVIAQSLWYHLGRISTYGLVGLFFGSFGWGIALTGYQNSLSIFLGVVLLLLALFPTLLQNKKASFPFVSNLLDRLNQKLSRALSIRGNFAAYRIGLLNGFLPCGLVYFALVGAIAAGSPWQGAGYMMIFGLGTLPMLLGIMVFGKLSRQFFSRFYRWMPLGLFLMGLYLIYRGSMLDIPVELYFWEATNFPVWCH